MKKKNIVKIYKVKHLTNGDNPMPYATENSVEIVEYDEGEQPSLADMKTWVRSGNNSMIELIKVIHEGKTCHAVINEEGKIIDLPFNLNATIEYQAWLRENDLLVNDVIVGNCAVITNFELE